MNDAACAHSRVILKHEEYPGGYRSDYWECDSGCGARFYPAQTDQPGIRLRDWFAGMALQGMLSANVPMKGMTDDNVDKLMAREAYRSADAMLEERNKP